MPSTKLERDMPLIQQHWNNFISLVKQDLNDVYTEQKGIIIEIRKLEKIRKILQHSPGDIDFLLLHKESVLALDGNLAKKFSILEAFKNINNLGNAVAQRTYKEILESEQIRNSAKLVSDLIAKRDYLQTLIDTINDLIYEEAFTESLIDQLCKKHQLDGIARNAIALYPIIKTLKVKSVQHTQKTVKVSNAQEQSNQKDQIPENGGTLDTTPIARDIPIYTTDFAKHKEQYDKLKEQFNSLLNRYYAILKGMTPTEMQYYRIYSSLKEEELKDTGLSQVQEEYEEAAARVAAIKLFDTKTEIEKMIQEMSTTDLSDKDDIDFLGAYIEEFELLGSKLKELDDKLEKTGQEIVPPENPKVFFLTDIAMKPIIPEVIKERGFQGSLITILEKAQAGFIQQKKGSNIMPLKVRDKTFKNECGKTVFAVRNAKVIISYVKLNSSTGISNDGGIMVLTASLLNPNTIQEDTDRVIKEYREQIIRQIQAIERQDPQQLDLQSMVREEIMKSGEPNTGMVR